MMRRALILSALLAASAHAAEVEVALGAQRARFATPDPQAPLRVFSHATTLPLRDGAPQSVQYAEQAGLPQVRSGSLAFDALFALAVKEMRENSVSAIRDGSYHGGQPIDCACFETGELWHYLWTRDLSYAAYLGLAMLDPARTRNALEFKLSGYRAGKPPLAAGSADGLQIVQDTGSGGSWPVSTDRVSWAFGAAELLKSLPPAERAAFAATALQALRNTLENDRVAAWDADSGLYRGEQSFLDWREQSYAAWVAGDIAALASAKALSTNVAHYQALTLAASLAREQGDAAAATRYGDWAAALKRAINDRLWLPDAGMYSSLTAGHFDGAPLRKFDWLGQSLAILSGVADAEQANSILAHYPHGPLGAPVIWPQQPDAPVYHNRALWPFVTAMGLKAAALHRNVAVADAAFDSLLRGAALNLSNMENMEWLSGDPAAPVVNSRRQLWSVGGYLGMVVGQIFGIGEGADGPALTPFITARLRRTWLAGSDALELRNLQLHGKRLHLKVKLPPPSQLDGYYVLAGGSLNGKPLTAAPRWADLGEDSVLEVELGALLPGREQIARTDGQADVAPREPRLTRAPDGRLRIDGDAGLRFNLYRDGRRIAAGLGAGNWRKGAPGCYAAEAVDPASGLYSHHSAPLCDGAIAADGLQLQAPRAGRYHVQLRYANLAHKTNLGITNAVQWLRVRDQQGRIAAEGVVQLPHTPDDGGWSTPLTTTLKRGSYRLELAPFMNMSDLRSNAAYADAGGVAGARNAASVQAARLLPAAPAPAALAHGSVQIVPDFASPQLGNKRSLRIYLPASYASAPARRYPVLYMHDGQNLFDAATAAYGAEWQIDEVMDRMTAQGKLREVIVVGIDNTPERVAEYTPCCDARHGGGKLDAYGAFIVDTVKPWVDAHYRTRSGRADTAIMGSSLGGIASLGIAARYPQVFSMAGGMSSSFWWNEGALVRQAPPHLPLKIYIDAGTAGDGLEGTQDFRRALLEQGYREGRDLLFHADDGGIHNERSWASRVRVPLAWFFGKP